MMDISTDKTSSQTLSPPSSPAQHVTIIKPPQGWAALDLKQLWLFRDLFWTLAMRDIKLRYRQTALGALWVIIQPVMAACIFAFIFGKVAALPSEGIPYIVFSFAGQLGWNIFNSTLGKASGSIVGHSGMISKVYFPRMILPFSSALGSLLDFCIAFGIFICFLVFFQITPGIQILLTPFWLLILLALGIGFGLIASALMVSYRDVGHVLPVLTNLLLYASPVHYSLQVALDKVGQQWQFIFLLNPLSGAIDGLRWSLLNTNPPQWPYVIYSASAAVVILSAGMIIFKRLERNFADII
jgi:lipopolysaccharide transport system permease protein